MNDWQMNFNGLTFGAGTVYRISNVIGLHDLPDVRSSDQPRSRQHGEFAGIDLLGGRDIDVQITVTAKHPDDTTWQALSQALVAGLPQELPLTMQIPGVALGNELQVQARVRRLSLPVDMDYYVGVGRGAVSFHLTDPRLYSSTETSLSVNQAAPDGSGLTFNATFPLTFGGGSSGGQVVATNDGEFAAPWVATLSGPVTNPRLENVTSGEIISFDGTVNSGETLVVSSLNRTVLLNGTASRYSWLEQGSTWFDLAPGNNTIRFAGTSGTGSMTFVFRSAWI